MKDPAGRFLRRQGPEDGLANGPSRPCRAEAMDLLAIADTLASANPRISEGLDDWRRQVDELMAGDIGEDLATERKLENLAMKLRNQWMRLAHSVVVGEMRSPALNHLPLMPVAKSARYMYERVAAPWQLEEKVKQSGAEVPGWTMEVSVFGNGMAAITGVITALRRLKKCFRRADGKNLQWDLFGGYFETLRLIKVMDVAELACRGFQNPEMVLERFREGVSDILSFELIAYDWDQTVMDPLALLEALESRPADRPWILAVDTTLLGPIFDPGPLLSTFGDRKPLLVLEIRSGLKLDQVGLEFSNVGVVRIFTPHDLDTDRYPAAGRFRAMLTDLRKLLGSGLSYTQMAVLDAPWIFHPEWMERHSKAVLDNNRRLALALVDSKGIFARVHHPCTGPQRELIWAESPLVIMEFHPEEDKQDHRDLLLGVIAREILRRNLVFELGSSFGFRHHRCEILVPEGPYTHPDGSERSFLKVAMGARYGPSLEGAIELFRELAAFPCFQALRESYPDVKPAEAKALFPDLQTLRLIR